MFRTDMFDIRPIADPAAVVQGEHYRISVLTDGLFRLEWSGDGRFEDRPSRMALRREFPVPEFTVTETEDELQIETKRLHLYYDKKPFSAGLSIAVKGMIKHKCTRWFYGQPAIQIQHKRINLMGTARTLDAYDGEIELPDGILDRHGFHAVDDSSNMRLNDDGWFVPAEKRDYIDLYFFGYLQDHEQCIRDYYLLTGPTPMVPRYALGNWWSRYYKYSEETYSELLKGFEDKKIPLSVAVLDMDWHVTKIDPKYGNGWTSYTWNRDLFPVPERFLQKLHDDGLKVTMNIHPHDDIRGFEDCYKDVAEAMGADASVEEPIDFDVSDPKYIRTYMDKVLGPLERQGVDFWWIDWQQWDGSRRDGYEPLFTLNHYLYINQSEKDEYGLILSRFPGLGGHRYPLGFSGDTVMTWESLDFQPYFTNCAANVGYGWWSHDIGGHTRGIWDAELETRWVQYGVFSPIYRPHSTSDAFMRKEPWNFRLDIEKIMTDFMRLRHALVPYLYTMDYRNHAEGVPLIRPLYHRWPKKMTDEAMNFRNEYTFGSELLICPITSPMSQVTKLGKVKAWIPAGDWFDVFTGRHYRGEKIQNLYRPLETYPVLAQAGGIVPLADDGYVNGTPLPTALLLKVYAGADGDFTLYEDNSLAVGNRSVTTGYHFRWGTEAEFTVDAPEGDLELIPAGRFVKVDLMGVSKPEKVQICSGPACREPAWTYDEHKHVLSFEAAPEETAAGFKVRILSDGKIPENRFWKEDIEQILARSEMSMVEKTAIFKAATGARTKLEAAGGMASACTVPELLDAIMEVMTSEE